MKSLFRSQSVKKMYPVDAQTLEQRRTQEKALRKLKSLESIQEGFIPPNSSKHGITVRAVDSPPGLPPRNPSQSSLSVAGPKPLEIETASADSEPLYLPIVAGSAPEASAMSRSKRPVSVESGTNTQVLRRVHTTPAEFKTSTSSKASSLTPDSVFSPAAVTSPIFRLSPEAPNLSTPLSAEIATMQTLLGNLSQIDQASDMHHAGSKQFLLQQLEQQLHIMKAKISIEENIYENPDEIPVYQQTDV